MAGDQGEVSAPSGYLPDTQWSLRDVLLVIGAGVIASVVAQVVIDPRGTGDLTVIETSMVIAVQSAASLGVLWVLSQRRGTGNWGSDFGLTMRVTDLWAVVAGGGLQIGVALLTAPLIFWLFPEGPPEQGIGTTAESAESLVEALLFIFLVAAVAPLVEEIIFRGLMLSRLSRGGVEASTQLMLWFAGVLLAALSIGFGRSATEGGVVIGVWSVANVALFAMGMRWPVAWAVGNTAAIFAVIHLLDPNAIAVIPGLFIIGIVLGIVAVRRGNLSLAIPLHAGVNLIGALLLIYGDRLVEWSERLSEDLEQVQGVIRLLF